MLIRHSLRGLVVLLAISYVAAGSALAGDFYVTTTADGTDGICAWPYTFPCSLRDAVLAAETYSGLDTIHVPAGTYSLTILGAGEEYSQSGDLDVWDDVVIQGAGADSTIIDASAIDRVFHILADPGNITLNDLTIRGGLADIGAGVAVSGGAAWVVLNRCVVEDNEAVHEDVGGGGIYAGDGTTMSIVETTLRENRAVLGSAIFTQNDSTLRLERSAVYDNTATNVLPYGAKSGGAILVAGSSQFINSTIGPNFNEEMGDLPGGLNLTGTSVIDSCTIADNDGQEIEASYGSATIRNSIVVGSCSNAYMTSEGGNVEGPGNTCWLDHAGDLSNMPIQLAPLSDYGGLTPTRPPVHGSLAIDNPYAAVHCQSQDQRGVSRPSDGDGNGVAECDSGAVELSTLIFLDGFEVGSCSKWSHEVP
jgi:CSLREA domain-containing protein